jgi:hypothetical protein
LEKQWLIKLIKRKQKNDIDEKKAINANNFRNGYHAHINQPVMNGDYHFEIGYRLMFLGICVIIGWVWSRKGVG